MKFLFPLIIVVCIVVSCSDSAGPEEEGEYTVLSPENPQPGEDRLFGINPSESSEGFFPAFELAVEAGLQVTEINLSWDQIETSQGVYEDPYGVLEAITFYGSEDVEVLLTIAVINTVVRTVPDYLDGYDYNSPEVIQAFDNMIEWVLGQISPTVTIAALSIGNEVDILLDGSAQWSDYEGFFLAAAANLNQNHPDLPIGVKCTVMNGLFKGEAGEIQSINQFTDMVMLTYYPLDDWFSVLPASAVHEHFDQVVSYFPEGEIWITEVGYPSGLQCNSSETSQAHFFHEVFTAWDDHKDKIDFLLIDWLHEATPEQVAEWELYYGLSDPAFLEFLATLGLRNYDNTDKYAWVQLLAETNARGWD